MIAVSDCHRLLLSSQYGTYHRNLGSYQWCSLVMNQRQHGRGGTLPQEAVRAFSCSLPKLWEQSREERADFWKHLLQATHCYWHSSRSWEEKGEEKWNRKARAYFSLWLLTSLSFSPVFLSIWLPFKGCFKLSPTTSSLSLCSSAYRAQAINFQMLRQAASVR